MKEKHKQMFMRVAHAVAQTSPAKRLKVGSVAVKNNIVIGTGYNSLAGCLEGPCEDENGVTKPGVRHSEKNLLLNLAKCNESSVGITIFCTHSCCYLCSLDLIDAGITKFVYETEFRETEGLENLKKYGVIVEKLEEM